MSERNPERQSNYLLHLWQKLGLPTSKLSFLLPSRLATSSGRAAQSHELKFQYGCNVFNVQTPFQVVKQRSRNLLGRGDGPTRKGGSRENAVWKNAALPLRAERKSNPIFTISVLSLYLYQRYIYRYCRANSLKKTNS